MKYYGYIEGYYGRELTQNERCELISALSQNGLNSYILASKEDPYHRLHWRETPSESYMNDLTELIIIGEKQEVTVIPAIAPGLSFIYGDEEEETILIDRLIGFFAAGAKTVALLMDDVPLELPKTAHDKGVSLGEAHGLLLQKIVDAIPSNHLLFCPTLYTDELLNTGSESNTYLEGLKKTIPATIPLFWTGNNTIAETITEETTRTITEHFGDRVIFWDNFYANDYATTRLFVGPYVQRDHSFITEKSHGVMINPTGMVETDKLLLDIFGSWYRTGKSTTERWNQCAFASGLPQLFLQYLPWFSSPFSYPSLDELTEEQKDPFTFFNGLLVEWQCELKLEWYPYLHRFFTELKLVTGKTGSGPWFEQRFLPHTASKLRPENGDSEYSIL